MYDKVGISTIMPQIAVCEFQNDANLIGAAADFLAEHDDFAWRYNKNCYFSEKWQFFWPEWRGISIDKHLIYDVSAKQGSSVHDLVSWQLVGGHQFDNAKVLLNRQ